MTSFAARIFKVLCKIWTRRDEEDEEEIIWKIEMCKYFLNYSSESLESSKSA